MSTSDETTPKARSWGMTDEQREKAKTITAIGGGSVVSAIIAVMIALGMVGATRDEAIQRAEHRQTNTEARLVHLEAKTQLQFEAYEKMIDQRLRNIEVTLAEIRADIRRGRLP